MYQKIVIYNDGNISGREILTFEEEMNSLLHSISTVRNGFAHEVKLVKGKRVLFAATPDQIIGKHYLEVTLEKGAISSVNLCSGDQDSMRNYVEGFAKANTKKIIVYWYGLDSQRIEFQYSWTQNL
ncbi:MAG: hypothetical protein NC218_01525 [Acetobacter sp.]|nr:hypothetical protein [Acetobacter sp.]